MHSPFLLFNGELTDYSSLRLTPENRSFRYGDGLFESIRIINGKALFLDDHLQRLAEGMKLLHLNFNGEFPDFKGLLHKLCTANKINEGAYARLTVFRRAGGKFLPDSNSADYIIETQPLPNEFALPKSKIIAGVFDEYKKQISPLNAVKSNNSLLFILAAIFARQNNYGEALILNERNEIIEAVSSNLFILKGKRLISPGPDAGALPGIMRKQVLSLAANLGLQSIEKPLLEKDLLEADELFLTNAVAGIKAVTGFKSKRYFKNLSLKIVKTLNEIAGSV